MSSRGSFTSCEGQVPLMAFTKTGLDRGDVSEGQGAPVVLEGGRGKHFFPVRTNRKSGYLESSVTANSFYSIPPPDFTFSINISSEKLL